MRETRINKLLVLLLIVISLNGYSQSSLILKFNNGNVSGTLLSTLDKMTFSGSDIVFTKTDASTSSYPIANIRNMMFGVYSAIPEVIENDNKLIVYPNPASKFIRLKNFPEGNLEIQIIGFDGAVLIYKKLGSGNEPLDISHLNKGLFLMKVNNQLVKFIKQ